ncbi:hypothetical protein QFC22_003871 [Naganishia vaughanmartiniae]|uniref:Uncharacterized protein n=1 Tax=Naganishia vaughanmartiniae TaxID=1424756 RepID=A0ACC2X5F8_9TREE|nr:hypothetical protein QFC22_003871 [Naganishia vaughanmartiniae]
MANLPKRPTTATIAMSESMVPILLPPPPSDSAPSSSTMTTPTTERPKKERRPRKPRQAASNKVETFPNLKWTAEGVQSSSGTGTGAKEETDEGAGVDRPLKRKRTSRGTRGGGGGKANADADSNTGSSSTAKPAVQQPLIAEAPRYRPIVESTSVPLHLRHPFRSYPPSTTFDITQAIQSEPVTERHPTPAYFQLAAAPPNEYWRADNDDQLSIVQRRKLVVLDLNGALLVRSERTSRYVAQAQRKVFPRPFLNCFLDYLLEPAVDKSNTSNAAGQPQLMRPYDVFIWSSAQPKSIDDMIQSTFQKWGKSLSPNRVARAEVNASLARAAVPERRMGRVLGVWSRAEMDQKSTTFKDLDKLYKHFAKSQQMLSANNPRFFYPDPRFAPDASNTLLIDDSTTKACLQPFNHLPIRDFELEMLRSAVEAVDADERAHGGVKKTLDKVDVLRLVFGGSALEFWERCERGPALPDGPPPPSTSNDATGPRSPPSESTQSTQQRPAEKPTVDGILLAIVGILSELKDVASIPAWIASGGLQPDVSNTFTREVAEKGWEYVVELDRVVKPVKSKGKSGGKKRKVKREQEMDVDETQDVGVSNSSILTSSIAPADPAKHTPPQTLPSHPSYAHWYDSPLHVLYWVRRGLVALEERGIRVHHNMTGIKARLEKAEQVKEQQDEAAKLLEDDRNRAAARLREDGGEAVEYRPPVGHGLDY